MNTTSGEHVYRGRFAPSPTGPLHLGSLIAAVGSFLQARVQNGEWLLRMEDLDPLREVKGAADDILRTLERFGFGWDGPVVYQSARSQAYEAAIEQLREHNAIYPCGCSRREIAAAGLAGPAGPIYPGTCRNGLTPGRQPRALRLKCDGQTTVFIDALQGPIQQHLEREVGDFVIKRADGMYAYQLAVVVDDAAQGITEVVRGSDLLYSTPRQIHLQRCLALPQPTYLHLPVAVNDDGEKLSKQTGAAPLDARQPQSELVKVMTMLGQAPPDGLEKASLTTFWQWALENWRPGRIPQQLSLPPMPV